MFKKPKRKIYFLIFVLPTLLAFIIGFVYPFFSGIYLSFCKFRTTSDATFVGFDNYIKAFQNEGFIRSFWFTALFVVVSVVLINLIAFFVAYALTLGIRGSNIFRTVFFVPNLIGGIILGYIWQLIFNGILQYYGTNINLDARFGFWGLIILMCWQQAGYMMIIYIAGFQSVPGDLYEAARIDGAGKGQLLKNVTIPMMAPSITICTFLTLTNSFKLFDQNLALTGGAPGVVSESGTMIYQTQMMALNIYNTFYANQNSRGVGQAEGVIFFLIVVVIALAQLYFTRKREVQQ
ncbi:MAG: sugar ABC transporter permease [Clostridiales bacterium]|nr:sugar ABC transporter permease [Clostridiales bacterium]